jgi:outer membrane protein TolC
LRYAFLLVLLPLGAQERLSTGNRTLGRAIGISEAVEAASKSYPSIRISQEQAAAAAAQIQVARASFLPKLDAVAGINRATRNNIFGLMLPSQVIAPISGPALLSNSMSSVWGSTVGLTVSWEPFDFGLRRSQVDVADAGRKRADLAIARTQFEVAYLTADTYLTLLAAEQVVRAASASYLRAQALERAVTAVVQAELRPGGDLTRAQAESALAMNMVIQAEQARDLAKATLAQLTGESVNAQPGGVLDQAPKIVYDRVALDQHPQAREQGAAIEEVKARERSLDRAYYPKFLLQGTSYARGTGAYDPLRGVANAGNAVSGLGPNIQNWAVGFTMIFPVFDFPAIRAKKEAEVHREKAEQAKYDQVLRELNGNLERARASLMGAQRTATNVPALLKSAREGKEQASARYQAGLSTIVEVADAERLLAQTEIDAGLVNLNIWRAILNEAGAVGDLEPFLKLTK